MLMLLDPWERYDVSSCMRRWLAYRIGGKSLFLRLACVVLSSFNVICDVVSGRFGAILCSKSHSMIITVTSFPRRVEIR